MSQLWSFWTLVIMNSSHQLDEFIAGDEWRMISTCLHNKSSTFRKVNLQSNRINNEGVTAPIRYVSWVTAHTWRVVLWFIPHDIQRIAWRFAGLDKSGPTMWVPCSLVGRHPSVLVVSHACQILSMHLQDMWKWCQHLHNLCFSISQHTLPWGWPG